ncbi:M23 family metallopeptidase [Ornithinimicrobium murale]|uniref:M23 family metallopeptidase n=1 Tax=Ornithinimicrobium murale TaxID=1050153 RepID=UPI000E0CC3DB|nr:M23 family metallopeptidase [Ornithinimicrobium murale]
MRCHRAHRLASAAVRVTLGLVLAALCVVPVAAAPDHRLPVENEEQRHLVVSFVHGLTRAASHLVMETVRVEEAAVHGTVGRGASQAVEPRGSWQWPLPGQPEVVNTFDPPEERWLPGHRGVDLAGFTYAPVLAVADGTVSYSGRIAGVGIVSVTHPSGVRSTYQPVTERIEQGQPVSAGDRLGLLGVLGSHCLPRTCLHLGAVRGKDDYLDPLLFLQAWELTLLPHEP